MRRLVVGLLGFVAILWVAIALGVAVAWAGDQVAGAGKTIRIPHDATRYRADLVRSARLAWGLDAPVATFGAQIHQESAWRSDARSHVGARGLAQFMPATERWIDGVYDLGEGGATNPAWALRALTRYDRWIWDRAPTVLPGPSPYRETDCARMAATLRGYNGGLGWVQKEARSGKPCEAFRPAASCRENLDYPARILWRLEPAYVRAGWGRGSCA